MLEELQWPDMSRRIKMWVQQLVAKVLKGLAPVYLAEKLHIYVPRCSLRSSDSNVISLILGSTRKHVGKGIWSVAAPRLWNQLLENACTIELKLE